MDEYQERMRISCDAIAKIVDMRGTLKEEHKAVYKKYVELTIKMAPIGSVAHIASSTALKEIAL